MDREYLQQIQIWIREELDRTGRIYSTDKSVWMQGRYGWIFAYLRRDGLPTQPSTKGSTFKGPFHLPRSLTMVDTMITQLLAEAE